MYRMNGVVPPMITPFQSDGQIDETGLTTLVEYLSKNVHGLFICGSYGCGPMMSTDERKRVAQQVVEIAKGSVDVIVHIGSTNTKDSADLASHASEIGADAVAAVGPYYFHHQDDSVIGFYQDLVAASGIPVYVYNNPKFQGYPMSIDLVQRLRDVGVHGIKDATFDIMYHGTLHRVFGDTFDIALGTEAMFLPAASLGTSAFIPGIGNAFPELNTQMFHQAESGDFAACRETQFRINKMREVMYLARSTQLAVYAMLEIREILSAVPRKPFIPATKDEKEAIRKELVALGVV